MKERRNPSPAGPFPGAPLSMYPTPVQLYPDLAVEPDEAFDTPELRETIPPRHDPEWLGIFIGKSLAGYDVRDPSPDEFVGWFQPQHVLTGMEGGIVNSVLGELHRHGGMPWLWKLSRTLGVSVRDIARTMREANVHAAYPCLWINQLAWDGLARGSDRRPTRRTRKSTNIVVPW